MVQSVWRQGVACVLGVGLSACATVPVGSKSYVAKASVQGGQKGDGKVDTDLLALEYKDSGVLSPGGKIAVLPMYPCDTKVNRNCYAEIDKLEHALGEAGFWVEHWQDLLAGTEEENLARVKERGIEHALEVQEYHLVSGSKGYAQLKDITLLQQDEAKKPRDLELSPKEWKVVGPRCVKYFEKGLLAKTSAARAEMAVRLISVSEQRVLWTHRVARWGDDRVNDIQVFHDVPKEVKNKKSQRYWGLGMAVAGAGLGIGAAAGAKKMSTPATLVMAGVGLISAGIGGWLIYDSRPREVHELGPADVLCDTKYVGAQSSGAKLASSRFQVASSGGGSSVGVQESAIENAVVFNVVDKVKGLERKTWQKPKSKDKKKEKKKDKKKTADSDVLSALACRWEDKELRCKAACTLCEDPWEGPCEICRPRRLSKRKGLDPNNITYEEFQTIQAMNKSILEVLKAQAEDTSDHDAAAKEGKRKDKKKKAKKKKSKADKKSEQKVSKADIAVSKADAKSGKADKEAGKNDARSGEADNKVSKADKKSGKADEKSSKADAKSGKADAKVGEVDKESGKADEEESKTDEKSSKADEKSGKTDKEGSKADEKSGKTDKEGSNSDAKSDKADAKSGKSDAASKKSNGGQQDKADKNDDPSSKGDAKNKAGESSSKDQAQDKHSKGSSKAGADAGNSEPDKAAKAKPAKKRKKKKSKSGKKKKSKSASK